MENMMKEMLKKENIQIVHEVVDWKDAIRISLQPLVAGGYVESRYIQGVIDSTIEYGPYYVLTEDVALIHGRPEQGVIKKQLAVTLLREAVHFSENGYPVRLLVALAASDSDSHIDVMKVLAAIFMEESRIHALTEAGTEDEIYEIFMQVANELNEV